MVPANSHRISRVPRYSGYCSLHTQLLYGAITRYGRTFQISSKFEYSAKCSPITPAMPKHRWFGLFPFRSPLLRESLLFSFPPGTKMFQFPGCAVFRLPDLQSGGLPHSEIFASKAICASAKLIAAYHVLHRY